FCEKAPRSQTEHGAPEKVKPKPGCPPRNAKTAPLDIKGTRHPLPKSNKPALRYTSMLLYRLVFLLAKVNHNGTIMWDFYLPNIENTALAAGNLQKADLGVKAGKFERPRRS